MYPAATLLALGIDPRGYKQDGNHRRRILRQLPDVYLEDEEDATACIDNDDALDAVVCALTARLYVASSLVGPPDDDIVRREVWIFALHRRETDSESQDDQSALSLQLFEGVDLPLESALLRKTFVPNVHAYIGLLSDQPSGISLSS